MSVQALGWVFEHSESRLAARHVLLSIANHAKADGTGSWPSYETISHEARIDRSYVAACLAELEEIHELEIEPGAGPKGCNLYSLPKMRGVVETFNQLNPSASVVESIGSGSRNFQPEPSLTVLKPKEVNPENQKQEEEVCSKCGAVGRHRCGGYKSQKQRDREARRAQRPKFTPEQERPPQYRPRVTPTVAVEADTELDEDYPRL